VLTAVLTNTSVMAQHCTKVLVEPTEVEAGLADIRVTVMDVEAEVYDMVVLNRGVSVR
jgi:hypothetical protein